VRQFKVPFAYKLNKTGDPSLKGSTGLYEKQNCALLVAIQPKDRFDQLYLIASTHLNFNSNRGDIKLAELKALTDAIAQLRDYYTRFDKRRVAVIMCGDFNSTARSGVYEYVRSGQYDCLKSERWAVSGQIYGTYRDNEMVHGICFDSAVKNVGLAPRDPRKLDGKELREIVQWYTELVNTEIKLEFGGDMIPRSFMLSPSLDQESLREAVQEYEGIVR
jgi:hypothetical protein